MSIQSKVLLDHISHIRQVNMPVEEKISLSAIPQYYLPIETNTLQFDGTNNGNK